jgi:hypothetical protein
MLCVGIGSALASPVLFGTANYSNLAATRPWSASVYYEVYAPDDANPYGLASGHFYSYFYKITNSSTSVGEITYFSIDEAFANSMLTVSDLPGGGGNTPVDEGMHQWFFDYHFINGSDHKIDPMGSSDWLYGTSLRAPTLDTSTLASGGTSNVQNVASPNGAKMPEPGSAMLLGMGLLGFAGMLRRKFMA